MQLRRMVITNMTANSLTIAITGMLGVNIMASFSWNATTIKQKRSPTDREVNNDTMVANFAPFALPAPSSFATRTLVTKKTIKIKTHTHKRNKHDFVVAKYNILKGYASMFMVKKNN